MSYMALRPPIKIARRWFRRYVVGMDLHEAENYLLLARTIIAIGHVDGFRQIDPKLVQRYTNGEGCYHIIKHMFKDLLFCQNHRYFRRDVHRQRMMLATAIRRGYHHGALANVHVPGAQGYSGCLLLKAVFDYGLVRADLVKLMYALGLFTNRDLYVMKRFIQIHGPRFLLAAAVLGNPEDYEYLEVGPEDEVDEADMPADADAAPPEEADVPKCKEKIEMMRFIEEASTQPRSLVSLCTMVVSRDVVGLVRRRESVIAALPIPGTLKPALKFEGAINMVLKM